MSDPVILDTNLLVLLVVGLYNPNYIERHRRLQDYSILDYDNLVILLGDSKVVVTANVLTEASNLLWLTGTPHKEVIRDFFRIFIEKAVEHQVKSINTVDSQYFPKLGLTDAGMLDLPHGSGTILTVDLDLHLAALEKGFPTENFNQYRTF